MAGVQLLAPWHDFYLTAGAAAATLAGLLFVGLSLHIRLVAAHPEVRGLARVTLSDFFVVLVIALLLLAPLGDLRVTGELLIAAAGFSLVLLVRPAADGIQARGRRTLPLRVLVSRFGLSAFCYALLATMGALVKTGDANNGLGGLLGVVLLLLVVAVRNTWDLLVTVAKGLAEDDA